MNWLKPKEFFELWEKRYKPKGLFFDCFAWFNIDSDDMVSKIPANPGEESIDGLGEAFEWYAEIGDRLVIIRTMIGSEGSTSVSIPMDIKQTNDDWRALKVLESLPFNMLHKLSWVRSQGNGDYSLFYRMKGVTYSVFSNTSKDNSEELKNYLESRNHTLLMGTALTESFNDVWAGYREQNGKKVCVCRYGDRSSVDLFLYEDQIKNKEYKYEMVCEGSAQETEKWGLFRLDDNDNTFLMQKFNYHVDARMEEIEYQAKGHHQTYWVENVS